MTVSIIIPVYNVAQYIRECIQSVMNQTMTQGLECIIVDDCSQDNSIEIVEEMVSEYEGMITFRIIRHDRNRGLSAARNTGISAATGEWIYFLDGDDWISSDCVDTLLKAAKQAEGIEMAVGQLETFDNNGHQGVKLANGENCPKLNLADGVYLDNILQRHLSRGFYEMACNKLINLEFLKQNNLYFKEGLIHEDSLWSFYCSCLHRRISVVNKIIYHYRIRSGSIMSSLKEEKRAKALNTILCDQIDFVNTHGLSNDRIAFNYLFPRIKHNFFSPLYRQHPEYASDLYDKLERIHYWPFIRLWQMVPAKRDFVPSLSRMLPKSIGFWFYRKVSQLVWKV